MASFYRCATSTSTQSILGVGRPTPRPRPSCTSYSLSASGSNFLPIPTSNFRLKNAVKHRLIQRLFSVHASNTNPPERDSVTEKSDTSDGAAQGPPFLTILAGFLVLLLGLWVIRSTVMWLISLIISVLLSK